MTDKLPWVKETNMPFNLSESWPRPIVFFYISLLFPLWRICRCLVSIRWCLCDRADVAAVQFPTRHSFLKSLWQGSCASFPSLPLRGSQNGRQFTSSGGYRWNGDGEVQMAKAGGDVKKKKKKTSWGVETVPLQQILVHKDFIVLQIKLSHSPQAGNPFISAGKIN